MKTVKCIHPRKVNKIIAEFANAAGTLPISSYYDVECENGFSINVINNLDIEKIIVETEKVMESKVVSYALYETPHYFKVRSTEPGMNYSVESIDEDEEVVFINVPKWSSAKYDDDVSGKCFRKDFIERCPLARGFADVTISILHEIGHRMTYDLLPADYDRETEEIKCWIKGESLEETNYFYFKMLDETLATNWAIEWLQNAENRKLAKAFERKFWACFI